MRLSCFAAITRISALSSGPSAKRIGTPKTTATLTSTPRTACHGAPDGVLSGWSPSTSANRDLEVGQSSRAEVVLFRRAAKIWQAVQVVLDPLPDRGPVHLDVGRPSSEERLDVPAALGLTPAEDLEGLGLGVDGEQDSLLNLAGPWLPLPLDNGQLLAASTDMRHGAR